MEEKIDKTGQNTLGKILRKNREMQQLSKQKVCRGLCTVMALARYESDERIPDKFLMDALLERLGLNSFRYEFVASDQEFDYSMKRERIEKLLHEGCDKEVCLEAIKEYENQIQEKDRLHQQYLLLKKGIILGKEKKYRNAIAKFREALECTGCNELTPQKPKDILLTNIETELFYFIAKFQYLQGDEEQASIYFFMLKNYIEQRPEQQEKWKEYYPYILYYLAQHALKLQNFGTSYEYVKRAEKILIENYKFDYLYEILQLKEKVCEKSGIREKKNDRSLLLLKLMTMEQNGRLTKEGLDLWESIASQQL